MKRYTIVIFTLLAMIWSCKQSPDKTQDMSDKPIQLIQVNPGHFHAGLVQKTMYDQVDPTVHVFAPGGPELKDYLARINEYNTREENPTAWEIKPMQVRITLRKCWSRNQAI